MNGSNWKHGLIAAFVGGMAGALDSGIALLIVAPNEFDLSKKLGHTLLVIGILGVLSGAKLAFAYLKQSPTPWDGTTDRRNGGGTPTT